MVISLAVTPEEWLELGLQSVGFGPIRQNRLQETNVQRFVAHYGASPESHRAMFSDLQTTQIKTAHIAKPYILHFLMAMFWLKNYPTESVMAGTFKVDEKTIRTQVWKYVLAIQALKEQKVNAVGLFRFLQTVILTTLFVFLVPHLYLRTRLFGKIIMKAMKSSSSRSTALIAVSKSHARLQASSGIHKNSTGLDLRMSSPLQSTKTSSCGSEAPCNLAVEATL